MANPICLSPLKFYEDINWQTHRMSYAFGHIFPLIEALNTIPTFQFVLPNDIIDIDTVSIYSVQNSIERIDITQELIDAGLQILEVEDYKILAFYGEESPDIQALHEGQYIIEVVLTSSDNQHQLKNFYSEVICFTSNLSDYIEIRYRNNSGNFHLKNGLVTFPDRFLFRLFLKTEIGKPEYIFEEEATKRLGYNFIESQVSKKVYKFNVVIPEYICDAMRIIRLCDYKKLIYKEQEFDMISFSMDVDWQTQGDLASVNCEFETDNIITNLGGFLPIN